MTQEEITRIREQVSPMAIWMADATIRQARRALTGCTGWSDVKRHPMNLPEVEMAGEVLFRMFYTFPMAVKGALVAMPDDMDGISSFWDKTYFDEFVKALEKELHKYPSQYEVKLREPDWVLETC